MSILKKAGLLFMAAAMVTGLCACNGNSSASDLVSSTVSETGAGPVYEKTDSEVTVILQTDKDSYEKGEEIKYTLSVKNNRTGYTVSRIFTTGSSAETLAEDTAPSIKGGLKTGEESSYTGVLKSAELVTTPAEYLKTKITGDVETVTIRPYVTVNYGGEETIVRYIVEVVMFQEAVELSAEEKRVIRTACCHDPSIVVGKDKQGQKCYYIFGSHRAWYKSYDLENWTAFTNNLSTKYRTILAEPAKWSAHGSSNYTVDGYMWAPDVIYNEAMKKWCMYLSVDGDKWYSSIVLLTADHLEGDWTYEGIVVYSGFHNQEVYNETDVASVIGETTIPSRYLTTKWGDYFPNNIDACVFYDDDGNLWMSYGSWSGGIFMLELDENTGFRDAAVTYENNSHSDPYFGKKIAGGKYVSGEASYIQKIGDYYWLFMSYGGLEQKNGYNVRVYRSLTPDGDYVDEAGNSPLFDIYKNNFNSQEGVRLFGGYKWPSFVGGQVAQGHNSAFVDDDGRAYIVFHTRATNTGEAHYVKTHQLFLNKEGWLVAAPYQTSGESLKEDGYSVSEVAGEYDMIIHERDIDYKNLEVAKADTVVLNADGTITGTHEGTWSLETGTPYINLVIDGCKYTGVALEMNVEGTNIKTMVFTVLGTQNQITVWGSRKVK